MKRAYQIKDFATTFPGHGGFIDRFDCISLMLLFSYQVLVVVLFSDQYTLDKVSEKIGDMSPET